MSVKDLTIIFFCWFDKKLHFISKLQEKIKFQHYEGTFFIYETEGKIFYLK